MRRRGLRGLDFTSESAQPALSQPSPSPNPLPPVALAVARSRGRGGGQRPERTRLRKKLSSAGGDNSRLRWASLIAEKIGCIDEAAHVPSSARWPTYEMTVAVEAGSADTPSSSQ